MIRSNLIAVFVLTTACRAIPEEKIDDNVGHDLDDTASQIDTANEDTGEVDTDDTAPEDTGGDTAEACNYTLYVVAVSDEAAEADYTTGWHCFPTSPYISPPVGEMTVSASGISGHGYGILLGAAPEGDVMFDFVEMSLTYLDDNGTAWGETLNAEYEDRLSATDDDGVELDIHVPERSSGGMNLYIGSYDYSVVVEAGSYDGINLSLNFESLGIMPGDAFAFTLSAAVAWHTDTMPMIVTRETSDIEEFGEFVVYYK